jgi:hypothetical protein
MKRWKIERRKMMNRTVMKLPELNCLKPNEHTTFRKLVEEIAGCNTAINELRLYEEKHNTNYLLLSDEEVHRIREEYKKKLNDVMGEIMDIAQVCASQLFVFENKGIDIQTLFEEYRRKSELSHVEHQIFFHVENNCRYIHFEPTVKNASLQATMNQIILSMGKIAQLGKFTGDNGEIPVLDRETSTKKYVFELFEIIQQCFNLLYGMKEKYNIQLEKLFDSHVEKLIQKRYCSFEKEA